MVSVIINHLNSMRVIELSFLQKRTAGKKKISEDIGLEFPRLTKLKTKILASSFLFV
jgi:hypothetical protein